MKSGKILGYVPCDFQVPEKLKTNFAGFPPIFKNFFGCKNGIGDSIKTYAREDRIKSQPRKMLISSFTLQNGILITPLPFIYVDLGLYVKTASLSAIKKRVCTASYRQH